LSALSKIGRSAAVVMRRPCGSTSTVYSGAAMRQTIAGSSPQKPRFLRAGKNPGSARPSEPQAPRRCAAGKSHAFCPRESTRAPRGRGRANRTREDNVFRNPPADKINALLHSARIIAVVGLSDSPWRPSYHVAEELQRFGYRIIPVTPKGG